MEVTQNAVKPIMIGLQTHQDTGWIKLELLNGWKNYSESFTNEYNDVGYRVVNNVVYFRGLLCGINATSTDAVKLPTQIVSNGVKIYNCFCSEGNSERINIDYYISTNRSQAQRQWISLEGISYPL